MIVFFGTGQQRDQYVTSKSLDPSRVFLARDASKHVQGASGPIEVVIAGDYIGYDSKYAHGLLRYIHTLNQIHRKQEA
jgi:hypothetical protein